MADAIYPKFKEALLNGDIDLGVDVMKIVLVDSGYTYNAAHEDLADVGAGTREATSGNVASVTLTNGVIDFADVTITGLDTGETAAAYILYVDTGVEGTSRLVAFKDTASVLPLAGATGVNVIIQVHADGFLAL